MAGSIKALFEANTESICEKSNAETASHFRPTPAGFCPVALSVACFTDRGEELAGRIARALELEGETVGVSRCGEGGKTGMHQHTLRLADWTATAFSSSRALIFVGAAGIAVRAIAPHIRSKATDPAVLAVDDAGRFVIPLLSGHIGGANALARRLALLLGSTAVVTTATDGAGVFAVDSWAAERGWTVANPERIKAVSARLLAGGTVRLRSAFPVAGELPPGLTAVDAQDNADAECDILLDVRPCPTPAALHIIPRALALGLGCRRGTPAAAIAEMADGLCREAGVLPGAIAKVCSIDLKKDEAGVREFCRERDVPFVTFSAEELAAVPGEFAASEFVRSVAGVENVCERSAVLASGGGMLVLKKRAARGVTGALAEMPLTISF